MEALVFPAALEETPGAVTRRVRRVLAWVDADAVQTATVDELDGSLEGDLIACGGHNGGAPAVTESVELR